MAYEHLRTITIIVSLTLISGIGDAIGFVHAARVWKGGTPVWAEFAKSSAGFLVGLAAYWLCIRYLHHYGVVAPEVQTLAWFVVTMVAMAVVSRNFFTWHVSDQVVALLLVGSIGWLLVRTSS